MQRSFNVLFLLVLFISGVAGRAAESRLEVARRLEAGEAVKIVCFGDSITGVYYHSGGRRAWCDLLGLALQQIYPNARLEMINAGISGHTTVAALARMEKDVLSIHPQLVVVMFGMNDVTGIAPAAYRDNLRQIVQRARARGAEVILMTPNTVYPDDPRRPPGRLAEYAEIIRRVAAELGVPVADCHQAFAAVDAVDHRAWVRMMSDSIHPNMRGHRIFAEEVARTISGRRITLGDQPPLQPGLPHLQARLQAKQPVRVIAMKPFDTLIGPALQSAFPGARVEVTPWEVRGKSLAAIELEAKDRGWWRFRSEPKAERPDLILVAVPVAAVAPTAEQFYRSYSWVVNWSQSMGRGTPDRGWDCLVVLPSVIHPDPDAAQRTAEALALDVIAGQDVPRLQRRRGEASDASALLATGLKSLLSGPAQ